MIAGFSSGNLDDISGRVIRLEGKQSAEMEKENSRQISVMTEQAGKQ